MSKLLSILIPTYNREKYLLQNLTLLSQYIKNLTLCGDVEIIISDNCSQDNTTQMVENFIRENREITIRFFKQKENIGLERNSCFTLKESKAKYVMFLGDDDFLNEKYLSEVIKNLQSGNNIACIVPSIIAIDINGNRLAYGRDINKKTKYYTNKILATFKLLGKGHQLSGVTFLREKTLSNYEDFHLNNLYLFMYFVGFNTRRGNSIHITEYPVKVTSGQLKYWDYGKNGLLDHIFKNTKMVFYDNLFYRIIEELIILIRQSYRYEMYCTKTKLLEKDNIIYEILKINELTLITKIIFLVMLFPITICKIATKELVKKIIRKV